MFQTKAKHMAENALNNADYIFINYTLVCGVFLLTSSVNTSLNAV